jgi:two-component system, sensor histidine kinase RegB
MNSSMSMKVQSLNMESPDWLRNLRWIVMAGVAVAVALARWLGADFPSSHIFVTLGAFGLWNVLVPVLENHFPAETRTVLFVELLIDIVFITLVLWFSGGLVNPFVGFYIVNVLVAGLLLNSRLTVGIAIFATACVLLLLRAPPIQVAGEWVDLHRSPILYALPFGLITLIFSATGFILMFLTRMGKVQEQLRQRVKMDALGRLVAGLAHEIGTPLNSILVIARELESVVPEDHRKDVGVIAGQAKRCGEIVSLLLGYSRAFARRSEEVKYTPVEIIPWVRETYDWLLDAEAKKFPGREISAINFRIEADGVPATLALPKLIMRQVLENLLKNARDAVSGIKQAQITLKIFQDNDENEWVFVVEDNGPGFSKEEQDKAFEAFYTTKKMGYGSGLGLYISYYLLSQVGGRIVIEDHSGPGARMRVNLPRIEDLGENA